MKSTFEAQEKQFETHEKQLRDASNTVVKMADKLGDRLSYFFSQRRGQQFSAGKLMRILRLKDEAELQGRLDLAVKNGALQLTTGRVYNGKPVVLYSMKPKGW